MINSTTTTTLPLSTSTTSTKNRQSKSSSILTTSGTYNRGTLPQVMGHSTTSTPYFLVMATLAAIIMALAILSAPVNAKPAGFQNIQPRSIQALKDLDNYAAKNYRPR